MDKQDELPAKLLTDQGRGYISAEVKAFCEQRNITNIFSRPYNPTSNGIWKD